MKQNKSKEKKSYKYRRSIMLLCRLALIGATAGLFVVVWFAGYEETKFWNKGNYVVAGIYCILYFMFGTMYGVFKIGTARRGELIYSNALALLFTDVLTYFQLSLIFASNPPPEGFQGPKGLLPLAPIIFLYLVQLFTGAVILYLSNMVYFQVYPARDVLLICKNIENEERFAKRLQAIRERYKLRRIISQEKDWADIRKEIRQVNCVMIGDIDLNIRRKIVDYCYELGTRAYIVPGVEDILLNTAVSTHIFDTPVLLCKNYQLTTEQRILKRAMDIAISLTGLILLSPVMLLEALVIKLYDHGPVFYRQHRLTRDNREFELLKFRSMVPDAEPDGVARLASREDKRITPFGRFIRAARLDELPQLINILRGEMSVVGPRPERPELVWKNTEAIPEFKYRTKVKAGLTGYAQVYGKYNTTPEDKLKMDLLYIERYSVLLDIKLIFLTIKTLFLPGAAEGVAETGGEETKE